MKKIIPVLIIILTSVILSSCSSTKQINNQKVEINFENQCAEISNIDYLESFFDKDKQECIIRQSLYDKNNEYIKITNKNNIPNFSEFKGAKKIQEICHSLKEKSKQIREYTDWSDIKTGFYHITLDGIKEAKIVKEYPFIKCEIISDKDHKTLGKPDIFHLNNLFAKYLKSDKNDIEIKNSFNISNKYQFFFESSDWSMAARKFDEDKGYNSEDLEGLYVQGEFNIYEIYQKCKNNTYIKPRNIENECSDVIEFQEKYLQKQ